MPPTTTTIASALSGVGMPYLNGARGRSKGTIRERFAPRQGAMMAPHEAVLCQWAVDPAAARRDDWCVLRSDRHRPSGRRRPCFVPPVAPVHVRRTANGGRADCPWIAGTRRRAWRPRRHLEPELRAVADPAVRGGEG